MGKWAVEMLNKIDNGVDLTKSELSYLVFDYEEDTEEGENRRWSRSNETICKLGDRYFSVIWEEGLTEMQDNEFYNQPIEVKKETKRKTITVTNWVAIKKV
jgi:hypothetical protein